MKIRIGNIFPYLKDKMFFLLDYNTIIVKNEHENRIAIFNLLDEKKKEITN